MQILSISSAASTATVLNPVATSRSTAASTPASSTSAKAPSSTAAASTASSATTSSAKTSRSGGGGGSSSAAEEIQQAISFSTTVQGKHYSGSVNESNGQYTASVPSLAGASASGSSVTAAENALYIRIDELV